MNLPIVKKTLRWDRTAAEVNYVTKSDPPQAENLASEILSHKGCACKIAKFFKIEESDNSVKKK